MRGFFFLYLVDDTVDVWPSLEYVFLLEVDPSVWNKEDVSICIKLHKNCFLALVTWY